MNTIRVSNSLDPDQDRYSVRTELGPNCLQRLSANEKVAACKERVIFLLRIFISFPGAKHNKHFIFLPCFIYAKKLLTEPSFFTVSL